jgi:hypothetical protein
LAKALGMCFNMLSPLPSCRMPRSDFRCDLYGDSPTSVLREEFTRFEEDCGEENTNTAALI